MISPYTTLAAAVVRQAFADLKGRGGDCTIALDAADFLLRRFWDDTLWHGHLNGAIVQRAIRQRVRQRMAPWIWAKLPPDLKRLAA